MKNSAELEKEAVLMTANHMAAAARTAPKTRGTDNIEIIVIDDEDTKKRLIAKMLEIAKKETRPSFERDANSIAASFAIVAVGAASNPSGLNCGYCGYPTCDALKKSKGVCAYNSIDLGIAVASAISIAGQFHIDNRVMYSIGRAALDLKLFGIGVNQALGIPLSATGKNPYFDRK
ncbi:MAG: DUF2148 domain-containing protein [Candidatus Omnitrophica bacterium]|nr:DUF2148 domain-containing protein [Candidatus Omnitrophota bacterium]